MPWPALIGGGASLVGGYLGNRAARKEAARNRSFQQEMSSTAWQRAVKDMEAAGINPALAYSQGPASSPGGSMASQGDIVSPGVSSAMQATRMKKELNLLQKQIETTAAQGQKASAETQSIWRNLELLGDWTSGRFKPGPLWRQAEADANSAKAIARIRSLEIPQAKNIADIAGTDLGRWLTAFRYILKSGGR